MARSGLDRVDSSGGLDDPISRQLSGHVWVANVVFTQRQDVCPLTSTLLHVLHSSSADLPPLMRVSISVDLIRSWTEKHGMSRQRQ
jgi:hypothetical protein